MSTIKKSQPKRVANWKCLECGKLFYSVRAARNASMNGCPKCGGSDIDVNV